MFFQPKCSIFNRPVFTLNHLNISTVNQSKYLGIIISENNCAPDSINSINGNSIPLMVKNSFLFCKLKKIRNCINKFNS